MKTTNHREATIYGILHLALFFLVYSIVPKAADEKVIHDISWAIYLVSDLALIYWGISILQKLNRGGMLWGISLLLLTPIALIILGQLDKVDISKIPISYSPKTESNINNLPEAIFETDSMVLQDYLMNDSFTLNYMINNYEEYIDEASDIFPIVAAYELNQRNESFNDNTLNALSRYAESKGHSSFQSMVDSYKVRHD
jgi:hypothetical protein